MNKTITVFGATGAQGGGLVEQLLKTKEFKVRAITRNANSEKAILLKQKGCELIEADLNQPESLTAAFKGAYGTFVVTNAWDPSGNVDEFQQGKNAVDAAKKASLAHFVWSTLPNYQSISKGKYAVPHFAQKALVDNEVKKAGFTFYSFVEAPMYFQNLISPQMSPQPQEDGSKAWMFPMNPNVKAIHNGDISEFGKLVEAVFKNPQKAGRGQYLSMTPHRISWNSIIEILNRQGHNIKYIQVPNETFDSFYPGAKEMREMMNFWEEYTYFGPNADEKIARANDLVTDDFTPFSEWAKIHFK